MQAKLNRKLKKIPKLRSEVVEQKFWSTHSSAGYMDWAEGKLGIFSNLKLTSGRLEGKR